LLQNAGSLFQNSLTLAGMGAVSIAYGPWLPLALFASILPSLWVAFAYGKCYHAWWETATPRQRLANYYDFMLTFSGTAAEIRIFQIGAHFRSSYSSLRKRLRSEHLDLLQKQRLARLAAGVFSLTGLAAIAAWMVRRLLAGFLTLGDLTLFYQAFRSSQSILHSLMANLGQLYSNSLFLGNLFEFLDLEPQIAGPLTPAAVPARLVEGIHFNNVSFQYPGSTRLALQDLDLYIPAGKTVAIVGVNGAGKSTLVKLLCRFYDPTAGQVLVDGIDLREFSVEELRSRITVLFQDPVPYQATVSENIALGSLANEPDQSEIQAAAELSGAHDFISRLPQGYDTLLGKWYVNGEEISAGQWQRLALARAYLRKAEILILDEPTSFMDSWAEVEWFDRFKSLAAGRTALFITHRFTIAMRADLIYVVHEGQVVESGSHHDLVLAGGLYAQSWNAQMAASNAATL
jgi:ATP-binding cassette subfamily B protein